jgi:hypothetical protein
MPPQIAWPSAERQAHFERWLAGVAAPHGLDLATLGVASADASFRRYLRMQGPGQPDRDGRAAAAGRRAPLRARGRPDRQRRPARAACAAGRRHRASCCSPTWVTANTCRPANRQRGAMPIRADAPCALRTGALAAARGGRFTAQLRCGPDRPRAGPVSAVVCAARVRPDLDRCPAGSLAKAWWICSRATCWPSPPWPCTATGCHAT